MNTYLIKQYFIFLCKSTNEHGVHSPFVYDFITKCCYDKSNLEDYKLLKEHREYLLNNKETISVTDFGAGSKVFKNSNRSINKIATTAGITLRRSKLLYRITKYFNPKSILEIGTSVGLATAALSFGNSNSKVISLEGCPNTVNAAKTGLTKFNSKNSEIIQTEFKTYLNSIQNQQTTTFDLIYFDGNHTKKDTLDYFNKLLSSKHNDSIWIFDDIHWSIEMTEAWELIKLHPEVTVTIDSFYWGIVFFRKEQVKQNFIIRL
ncbi:O-methyltransferase [Neptunitalea chrysea]|uniref:O-methyltransferase n=1 Tax=Neptunitalea chrysea TaxID=1647581 RepID=A0A9W6B661_9FLAO|nr:class I SAM-dependent methyltransferase [Neptunitalea chrysea]GLB52032.1 O-methyltransferase [Neptunitalea chrysea]